MNLKNYKPILSLFWIVISCYSIHKIIFILFESSFQTTDFRFSIEILYSSFLIFSLVILAILIKIKQKSLDNVGMVFLILTTTKMVLCYVFIANFIPKNTNQHSIEKMNFFVMFMLFLIIETILTIRILNKKQ